MWRRLTAGQSLRDSVIGLGEDEPDPGFAAVTVVGPLPVDVAASRGGYLRFLQGSYHAVLRTQAYQAFVSYALASHLDSESGT